MVTVADLYSSIIGFIFEYKKNSNQFENKNDYRALQISYSNHIKKSACQNPECKWKKSAFENYFPPKHSSYNVETLAIGWVIPP